MKLLALTIALLVALQAETPQKNIYVSSADTVLPQVADGAGWKTTITLANLSDQDAVIRLDFFDSGGKPLFLDFVGLGNFSAVQGTIRVNGSAVIETAGTSGALRQGFAVLDSNKKVGGSAVFRQRIGIQDQEAVVPLTSKWDDDFIVPFDHTNGFVSGFAICNPGTFQSATMTVAFHDEQGNRFHLDQFTLAPMRREVFQVQERWPQTAGRRGTIIFTTPALGVSALALRFNSSGAFTTVLPMSR